ncbi:3,4-dihydroxy-2-butanone-4-phosphate synthase [Sphingomonas oligophenolica]|uniref:3,4-dihydroxy-2-butanone 4-phosphate synthase n=2 Tax=Sphingomonas oligophenolica TaxID=301154 RepID=A0ABU9YBF7_9SPHN
MIATAEEIVEETRNGRMFILVDDEDRENEGDLVIPAQMATPDAINFMAKHGRGLICLSLTRARAEQLGLEMMSQNNGTQHETAFTVSIEARDGVTTGISAADRARTIAVAIDASKGRDEIVTPGHVFPLVARDGGVLVRAGHTEASVDVARLAGLVPAGVICEIMAEDGTMARMPDLLKFAARHNLKIGTIKDLIAHRLRFDHLVETIARSTFRSDTGDEWEMFVYRNKIDGTRAYALRMGRVDPATPTLVRVHVASAFYDMLDVPGPRRGLIPRAMRKIVEHGSGIILVLLPSPDVGIGVGPTGNPADARSFGIGAQILADLGVHDMILLRTSMRHAITGVGGYGLDIVDEMLLEPRET